MRYASVLIGTEGIETHSAIQGTTSCCGTQVQGGGNCGNALTAAARLGLQVAIVSKIGGDSVGDGIVAEFERDGVSTQHLLRAEGAPSPFT